MPKNHKKKQQPVKHREYGYNIKSNILDKRIYFKPFMMYVALTCLNSSPSFSLLSNGAIFSVNRKFYTYLLHSFTFRANYFGMIL